MTPSDRATADGGNIQPERSAARVEKVPFNFRLGQWNLFSIARPLSVLEVEAGALPPGWQPDPANSDGCLINGLRAPVDPRMLAPRAGWTVRIFREYPRYLVDLTTGFDAYLGKFSGKTRSTLKRKMRKFHELSGGTTSWKQYRTTDEIVEFLGLARELSAKTYQERLLGAGLPAGADFTAAALARARRGEVRAFILFLNARPVSYLYLPVDRGRVVYAYLGYDPACGEHSPGTVLQLLAMECLFAEPGLSVFDFTQGAGQHKQLFATHAENCADVLWVKRATLTAAVAAAHSAFARTEIYLTGILDRIGVKNYLKRLLRKAATSSEPQ